MAASLTPALFLDRDGVINVNHGYVFRPDDLDFIDGIFPLIQRFQSAGFKPVIITNQSGIARGIYSEDEFFHFMDVIQVEFSKRGIATVPVYFCPHHPEFGQQVLCDCRKPQPGLIHLAADEMKLDLSLSVMVGDKLTDVIAAARAGIKQIVLFDPSGEEEAKLTSHQAQVEQVNVTIAHNLDEISVPK
ncbi:D-glycero-alpha-D-manno-heptose-1,7-bisphosphate 7-phosphatase [Alteromonas flava]|uniref:D-glycero-alpha-D-manno-heptose-1,7-bisphosphate 7-phosphatase n=1 Tax=Alteromonas flava TaxID=2048003 RepID=UPI00196B18F0|nr:HAD family hydrolase [Alteromonas flava]